MRGIAATLAHPLEVPLQLMELLLGAILQIAVAGNHCAELEMKRPGVAVLGVLEENTIRRKVQSSFPYCHASEMLTPARRQIGPSAQAMPKRPGGSQRIRRTAPYPPS